MRFTSVPDVEDLEGFPSLRVGEGDMGVWRTHLLKAAKASSSVKQRLISALLHAVHTPDCEFPPLCLQFQ